MAAEHSSQLKCQEGACRGCCDVCLPEPVGGWETVIVGSLSTSFHAIRKRGEGIRIRRGKERKKKKKERKKEKNQQQQKKKNRVDLLASPDCAAPLVISVGYRGCQSEL